MRVEARTIQCPDLTGDCPFSAVQEKSWKISKEIATGEVFSSRTRKDIKNFNKKIIEEREIYAHYFSCSLNDIDNLKITVPDSKKKRCLDKVTLIPRVTLAVARALAILPIFGLASIFHKSNFSNPKRITNGKTPILLIHGSGANQRQWEVFRQFLKSKNSGHVFSVALNKKALVNDRKTVKEYAEDTIAKKVHEIKKMYLDANYNLDEMIIIGHSMGGLIAAEYAVNYATDVKIKNIITLNAPWYGSWVAEKLYNESSSPQSAFLLGDLNTKNLREQILRREKMRELNIYTFSASLDPIVRPSSSTLPIKSVNQIYSQFHDHYSAMADPLLATKMRKRWIIPNTKNLERVGFRESNQVFTNNSRNRGSVDSDDLVEITI